MCGICGSYDKDVAYGLFQKNLERGRYSSGVLVRYIPESLNDAATITKLPHPFKPEEVPFGGRQYLFHSRAPTSRTIEYREIDTHPFSKNGIYVAHNGIITNAEELAELYKIDYSMPEASLVDSYVIPCGLSANVQIGRPWLDTMVMTLKQLKGTFGLWIHAYKTTHICRSGSTLYGNMKTGAFSSSPGDGLTLLKEGILYEVTLYGLIEVAAFKTKPMYYIP